MLQGTRAQIAKQTTEQRQYKQSPLIRQIEPTPEFVDRFQTAGFSLQHSLVAVPILTLEEAKMYNKDKANFQSLMCTEQWLEDDNRTFWICDGANRRMLCLRFRYLAQLQILDPCIPENTALVLAVNANEATGHASNETTFMDKCNKVRGLLNDGNKVCGVSAMLRPWGSASFIKQLSQVATEWNLPALAPYFEQELTKKYAPSPLRQLAHTCHPPVILFCAT